VCGSPEQVASAPKKRSGHNPIPALEEIVAPETAGDPMSAQQWVRSSLRTVSARLREAGHKARPPTVGRVLRALD